MIWIELAWRNLLANRRRTAIAAGAIFAATLSLVLFANYIAAIRAGLEYATIHGGTGHMQITGRGGFDQYSDEPLQFALSPLQLGKLNAAADRIPSIRRVVPRLQFAGLISNGPRTLSFAGTGVDPAAEKAAFGARQMIKAGTTLSPSSPADSAVLGVELARRLGLKVGDYATVLTPTVSGALNAMDFKVVGLETTGSAQSDLFYFRSTLTTAQSLLATDKVSVAAILLEENADLADVEHRLLGAVPGSEIKTWLELTPLYQQVVSLYENQFRVFGAFIIIITLFGLATLILTSVLERTREIGTLRALGITKLSVRTVFVIEGATIAVVGLVVGTLFAALAGELATRLQLTLPPPPGRTVGPPLRLLWDWSATAATWFTVLSLGILTAWIASGRVARLKVVDALGSL